MHLPQAMVLLVARRQGYAQMLEDRVILSWQGAQMLGDRVILSWQWAQMLGDRVILSWKKIGLYPVAGGTGLYPCLPHGVW